jgi:nucleotide-binding universal stress UspA family protein
MDEQRPELLVALGEEEGRGALDWAVDRALRSGLSLRLVHVVHARGAAGPENILMTSDAAELAGRQIVRAALERVEDLAGDRVPVTTSVPTGHAVDILASQADGCTAVVVQHDPYVRPGHVFGGTVAEGVAARVDVPVVSVPATWVAAHGDPARVEGGLTPRVTVGVAIPQETDELVAHAIRSADPGPGDCVTILHAWHVPAAYELGLMPPDFQAPMVEHDERELADLAEAWQTRLPGIQVETRLVHARPVDALVQASHNSDHLVLGRSRRSAPRHVGSVASALLRRSECPVELVPSASA